MPSMWMQLAVALAIAAIAFGIGQLVPGLGVAFVVLATTGWTAFSADRQRRLAKGASATE